MSRELIQAEGASTRASTLPDDALQGRLREDRGDPQQTQSSRIKALLSCAACRGALGEYEANMLE
jgi:hypothetical protein